MIQGVAYDVFNDKKNQMQIPKVIRLMSLKNCIEACQAFLIEQGKKPPATSTFYRLMKFLPAQKTKMMGGINPTINLGRKAFGELKKIVNKLNQMPNGLNCEDKMVINTMIMRIPIFIHV